MSIRLPNTTFQDNPSGRATWGRAVVDALRGLVSSLAGYQPLAANLTSISALDLTGHAGDVALVNAAEDGFELFDPLQTFTVATLPAATGAKRMIYVSDETGGAVPAFNDGTNWRRVTDRAVVS